MSLQKILKYKLPEKLDKELKLLIENSFFGAVDEMSDEEFSYIAKKIDNKLIITKEAATSWVAELSLYYSALFKVYHNETEISEEAFNLIGAALFYFINPF